MDCKICILAEFGRRWMSQVLRTEVASKSNLSESGLNCSSGSSKFVVRVWGVGPPVVVDYRGRGGV